MKKLLVVVDMQKDFVSGSLVNFEADKIVGSVVGYVMEWLNQGNEVVYTMDTHDSNYLSTQEGKRLPIEHCIKGSDGWQLVEPLQHLLQNCHCFEKDTFGSKALAQYCTNYDQITLCGVCTDICVISNAMLIKAYNPQAQLIILEDLCAGVTIESHETALNAMRNCQMDVIYS